MFIDVAGELEKLQGKPDCCVDKGSATLQNHLPNKNMNIPQFRCSEHNLVYAIVFMPMDLGLTLIKDGCAFKGVQRGVECLSPPKKSVKEGVHMQKLP